MNLKHIALGSQGLHIPPIGLGCMGMSKIAHFDVYGEANEAEAIATIHRSLEGGGNFLDTADLYGPLVNEQLVGKAIAGKREQYIVATKFGYEINDEGQLTWELNGSPDYVKKAAERSLKNLGTDYIDLYYLHRLDGNTPVEETVYAMGQLVKEGKVRYIGLSEVAAETIRKAHAVHPLTAVQSEYSLFERDVEAQGILAVLKELGIGFVAYSPLGRGFLSGTIKSESDFPEDDFRRGIPKFQGAQFQQNIELVNAVEKMAVEKGITSSQLAIAWVIAKGHVPIPGTKRPKWVAENIAAANIVLSKEEMAQLEAIVPLGTITGDRYDAAGMTMVNA